MLSDLRKPWGNPLLLNTTYCLVFLRMIVKRPTIIAAASFALNHFLRAEGAAAYIGYKFEIFGFLINKFLANFLTRL